MRLIKTTAALLVATMLSLTASASSVQAAPEAPSDSPLTDIPVTGVVSDGSEFVGTLTITEVATQGGRLLGSGTLTGTAGGQDVTQAVEAQDLGIAGSCEILDLDLGPLHLDLLGLVVDLAPVHLDITALTGDGRLVGNLLCAITGLLDGPDLGLLGQLIAQLNALLGGLLG